METNEKVCCKLRQIWVPVGTFLHLDYIEVSMKEGLVTYNM